MSALFVNKNLPSYSGLIFSKFQQQLSIKIHVNLAPDVQNMFASKYFLSAINYFVNKYGYGYPIVHSVTMVMTSSNGLMMSL